MEYLIYFEVDPHSIQKFSFFLEHQSFDALISELWTNGQLLNWTADGVFSKDCTCNGRLLTGPSLFTERWPVEPLNGSRRGLPNL